MAGSDEQKRFFRDLAKFRRCCLDGCFSRRAVEKVASGLEWGSDEFIEALSALICDEFISIILSWLEDFVSMHTMRVECLHSALRAMYIWMTRGGNKPSDFRNVLAIFFCTQKLSTCPSKDEAGFDLFRTQSGAYDNF